MKKHGLFPAFVILLLISAAMHVGAETVYVDELKKAADDGAIVFRNYSGPHNKIDTIEEIRGIGKYLGRRIGRDSGKFSFFGKYSVIHAVDYTTKERLDADIFIIHESAEVDHIKNLRRMIAGFLEEAYDYDTSQADVLAEFITVYNAVHRNDLSYFTEVYKDAVTKHLQPGKAGIALSYTEWPGKTMMLIPLTPQAGEDVLSDLDTDILSDEDVINQLRKEDDRGVEARQDLVELKDEEVLEEREKIEEERDVIEEKEAEIEKQKEELTEEAEELEQRVDQKAEERKEEIKEELQEIVEKEEEIAEEKEKLEERVEKVEEREEQIIKEREEIAEDQMKNIEEDGISSDAAIDKEEAAAPVKTVPFLKVSGDSGSYTGQLLLVDTQRASIVKRSEVDSIRLRGYTYSGNSIVSVAGSGGGTRIVSLVKIDPESLEITDSATVEVYIDSAVVEKSGKYYAVVNHDGWKIGVFDKNLKLEAVSVEDVFPATDIVHSNGDVIAQNESGRIIKLAEEDFTAPSF